MPELNSDRSGRWTDPRSRDSRTNPVRHRRKQGFSTLEILFAMALLSVVLAISVPPLRSMDFAERVQDTSFMDQLKGAIIEQRVRFIKEPGIGYNFVIDGSGTVRFTRQGVCYLYLNDPLYRVYIQKGVWYSVLTLTDYKNRTTEGNDGFTIFVYKQDRLMAKLVFQVATSTFREEYND